MTTFKQFLRWLWFVVAGVLMPGCLGGCQSDGEYNADRFQAQMNALEDANFKGRVEARTGGSPLGAGASNFFWLGPHDMSLAIDGEVDFTEKTRSEDEDEDGD